MPKELTNRSNDSDPFIPTIDDLRTGVTQIKDKAGFEKKI